MRKVGNTMKDSVWQNMLDAISTFKLYDKCKINKSEFKIELPNGSIFLFKGIDDGGEKIKSISGLTDCWLEEATEFTLEEFSQIKLRVRALTPNNQIILSYNPIHKENWVYNAFHNEQTRGERFLLKSTYLDNKFLPQDYIDSLVEMKKTNPYYYQVYALGEFGALGKVIYSNWKTMSNIDPQQLLLDNPKLEVCMGIDVGFNHPYAIAISLLDKEHKKVYVINEMYRKGITNEDAYKWICNEGYGSNSFICDSASPRDIEELKRLGLNVKGSKKGSGSVLNGISRIQNYEIIIDDLKCPNFIKEITGYTWKKDKNGNYLDEPIKIGDDLMDAFRYSLEPITKGGVKLLSKSLFGL